MKASRAFSWTLMFCGLLFGTGALFLGCSGEEQDGGLPPLEQKEDPPADYVVAMVNDTPLTWGEMDARAMGYTNDDIKNNYLMIPSNGMEEAKTHFRQRAISAFVLKTVMLGAAAREGIKITETDRQDGLRTLSAALKPRNWTPDDFFKKGPLPPDQMKREFEDGILIDKLFKVKLASGLNVTKEEVDREVNKIAATNAVRVAFLEQVRSNLVAGASFKTLADSFSECKRSRGKGGDIGEFVRGQLNKPLEDAAFSLPVGSLSPVIHSNAGYHILKIESRMKAQPATKTTPAVKESVHLSHIFLRHIRPNPKRIMQAVMARKFEKAKKEYYRELRSQARITCFLYPDMIFE